MKMKGIGALRDENGGMSQIPEPASAASAPAPGPESPARRALGIGASTGIGAATVRLLRSRGCDVEEFSLNRFHGDRTAADAVYTGVEVPLTASDVAECIVWAPAERPARVNIDSLIVRPRAQASNTAVARD